MLNTRFLALAFLASVAFATGAEAQSRDLGARRFILDDGAGFRLTLEAPAMTGNGTFTFPDPGTTSGSFVMTNSTTNQAITGPLSVTSGNSSLAVSTSGADDMVLISGRDMVGSDLPLVISSDNATLTYGVTTLGRMLRFDQSAVGIRDLGLDNAGNFFVTGLGNSTHTLDLSTGGNLTLTGNIATPGTVDGIDISAADAQNVKLTGNQTVAGEKVYTGKAEFGELVVLNPVPAFFFLDDLSINPGSAAITLQSDDGLPSNRTFTINAGSDDGQVLVLKQQLNASQLEDTGNAMLSGDMNFGPGDTLTLMWDSLLNAWLETSRSDN